MFGSYWDEEADKFFPRDVCLVRKSGGSLLISRKSGEVKEYELLLIPLVKKLNVRLCKCPYLACLLSHYSS